MKASTSLVISLSRGIVLCSILVFVLPAVFGADMIWWVMPITELIVAVFVVLSMKR